MALDLDTGIAEEFAHAIGGVELAASFCGSQRRGGAVGGGELHRSGGQRRGRLDAALRAAGARSKAHLHRGGFNLLRTSGRHGEDVYRIAGQLHVQRLIALRLHGDLRLLRGEFVVAFRTALCAVNVSCC